MVAVTRLADDVIQNYRGRFQGLHLSRLLVDESLHPVPNVERAATVRHHFSVKGHPAILVVLVDGQQDFIVRLDAYKFARLKVERDQWAGLAQREFSAI